ncbi:hypothetical protein ADIARSV_0802 [Arcticibacter svalbardensis MN12-7]|uniref:Uncharacterized protein n=1 Tax=Arcticibacter svalbardensis MN12-7 TaxID=1150600 RepID=R9GW49_9SPHI|nr:hypothetical protein ADIARSV_0802 [Arcticibacter svalbardensis MN12-7]
MLQVQTSPRLAFMVQLSGALTVTAVFKDKKFPLKHSKSISTKH